MRTINVKIKSKYLLALALPLGLSAALSGCNAGSTNLGAPATVQATGGAPEDSSAGEAAAKNGASENAASAMKADSPRTKLKFASSPATIPVGKAVTWTLGITDAATGAPVEKYDVVHDKKMHLIVVRNDLSWFNHLHPQLGKDGTFTVTTSLPKAGSYKLYADYTPSGQGQEVSQYSLATGGAAPAPSDAKLSPDKMSGPWLKKTFVSHPEAEPDKGGGATYQVAMMPMPSPLKAGQDSMLHFQIRDAAGKPVSDLQPYLGALGHCVIVSQDTSKYLHSHPMADGMEGGMAGMDHSKMGAMSGTKPEAPTSGGPDVMFHTNFPSAGLYKAWGQFKHRGQVITADFTISVAPGAPAESAGHTHAEGEKHSHAH